jgi:hypothetical protein
VNNLDAALAYARRGWAVHPLRPRSKAPASASGFKDATTDEAIIREWLATNPARNVGIATGSVSGIWVLDLDDGSQETLLDWEREYGGLPETPTVRTGGGGRHNLFAQPAGTSIPSLVKFAPGCDTRGDGGYIVAPPSIHESGRAYEWLVEGEPVEAPQWLLDLVLGRTATGMVDEIEIQPSGLADAPGAPKGERFAAACRLVGTEIARGTDDLVILREAIAWADRCSPPIPHDHITKIVGDLLRKDRGKPRVVSLAASGENIEAIELPSPMPWPDAPAIALRHGVVGEFLDAVMPHTEADPVAVAVTLLVGFGNAAGREPHALVGGTRHGTNEFAVISGQSGKGRKGTANDVSLLPIRAADPAWAEERIVSGLTSGEGIIHAVRDPITKLEPVREGRAIVDYAPTVVDAGEPDKRLLVIETELGSTLRATKREQSTLSPIMRAAWDGGNLRTLAKNSGEKATAPHVSLMGNITVEELRKLTTDTDVYGGLFNRVLWVLARRSRLLPDGGELDDLTSVNARIAALLTKARTVGRMRRSPAARELWAAEYARLTTVPESGILGAVLGRGEAHALRLSLILALVAGHENVEEADLRAAIDLYDYCAASARIIFGGATDEPLDARLLSIIRATPGIGRTALHKALGGRTPAREIVAALGRLRDAGAIVANVERTGGRPAETWAPVSAATVAAKKEERSPSPLLSSFFDPSLSTNGMVRRDI